MLEYLMIRTEDDEFNIKTETHSSKSFQSVARKLKDRDLIGLLQIDEGEFMAFIQE